MELKLWKKNSSRIKDEGEKNNYRKKNKA